MTRAEEVAKHQTDALVAARITLAWVEGYLRYDLQTEDLTPGRRTSLEQIVAKCRASLDTPLYPPVANMRNAA